MAPGRTAAPLATSVRQALLAPHNKSAQEDTTALLAPLTRLCARRVTTSPPLVKTVVMIAQPGNTVTASMVLFHILALKASIAP